MNTELFKAANKLVSAINTNSNLEALIALQECLPVLLKAKDELQAKQVAHLIKLVRPSLPVGEQGRAILLRF